MIELIPTLIVALGAFYLLDRQAKLHVETLRSLTTQAEAERRELLNRLADGNRTPVLPQAEPSQEPLYVPEGDFAGHDDYMQRREAGEVI